MTGQRWLFLGWLTAVWVALWGDLSIGNVIGGLAVGGVLLWLFPGVAPHGAQRIRAIPALHFAAYFLYKLVEANVIVAWEVVTPNNEGINEGIVAVPVHHTSDGLMALVANAISLTPGTLTIEVRREPPTLYVHVLHLRSIERTRAEVQHLQDLALRAFPVADARTAAEGSA